MKKIFLYSLIIVFALTGARSSLAATGATYTLLEPLPCIEGTGQNCTKGDVIKDFTIDQYISYIFKFAIAIAVFLAVVMIIVGGFQYMLSEAFTSKQAAKERITNAILGLLAALASYLILATIDPRLVAINTTLPAIRSDYVDKNSIDAFNKQLSDQFQALTNEERDQANAIQKNIDTKNQRIGELQQFLDNDSDLSEDQRNAYYTELQGLKGDVSDLTAQKTGVITQGTGSNRFREAIGSLTDFNNYTGTTYLKDPKTGTEYLMRNAALNSAGSEIYNIAVKEVTDTYDTSIKKLGTSNPDTVQELEKEKAFYLSELADQKNITQAISAYQNANTIFAQDANYVDALKPKMESALAEYQAALKNTPNTVPPKLVDQYNVLLNQRIAMTQKALASQK